MVQHGQDVLLVEHVLDHSLSRCGSLESNNNVLLITSPSAQNFQHICERGKQEKVGRGKTGMLTLFTCLIAKVSCVLYRVAAYTTVRKSGENCKEWRRALDWHTTKQGKITCQANTVPSLYEPVPRRRPISNS